MSLVLKVKEAMRPFALDIFCITTLAGFTAITAGWQKALLWVGSGSLLGVARHFNKGRSL